MINRSMQPRQMYGLGSLVKKAVKGVKNVIKSPIGKAAILGAVGFGIPGTKLGGLFGRAAFGGQATGALGSAGIGQFLMGTPGVADTVGRTGFLDKIGLSGLSTAKKAFLGGSAALSIAAMFPQEEGEDDDSYADRLKRLEPLMNRYYKNVNPNASAAEVKKFILDNTQEYRAMGGRVGYRLGGDTMDRDGIKSLEAGAPDVRYTGNMEMASETGPEEFEMDMLMELTQAFEEAKRQGFRGDFKQFLDMYLGDSARAPEGIMQEAPMQMAANGGRIGFQSGTNTVMGDIAMSKPSETFEGMGQNIMDILKRLPPALLEVIMNIKDSDRNNLLERLKLPEEKANGGRIGLKKGTDPEEAEIGIMTIDVEAGDDEDMEDIDDMDDMLMAYSDAVFTRDEKSRLFRALGDPKIRQTSSSFRILHKILKNPGMFPDDELILKGFLKMGKAKGGRIKYAIGANRVSELLILRDEKIAKGEDVTDIEAEIFQLTGKEFKSVGGISNVPTGKIRKNSAGIKERDYRDEGGFVPVGIKEKADDVPAMLSKNEFVMTADAVRGIGGGDVEKGSKKLYNLMKNAEQVGKA